MSQKTLIEEDISDNENSWLKDIKMADIILTNALQGSDKNNANHDKDKCFNILLTQSEKIIDMRRAQQINQAAKKESLRKPTQRFERDPILKQLRLQKGSSFWSLKDDYQTIYNNFNLLSYFSSSWGIQVKSRKRVVNQKNQIQIVQQFFLKRQQKLINTLTETNRDKFNKKGQLKIQYELLIHGEKEIRKIQVLIKSQARWLTDPQQYLQHTRKQRIVAQRFRQFIKIKVIDQTGWIAAQKRNLEQKRYRVSELRKAKVWETEYFYLEPLEERHKIIQGEHISLALQGGGCKGVQYIGAYQAILQSRQNVNIKSVIGSSAGGIIGLAICCKLKPKVILDICVKLLSKVTNDKKYKYKDTDFTKKTFDDMVQFMKTINIFEEKIIDKIMTWLKDKEFQSLFLKVILANTNPEVYKLFISDKNSDDEDEKDQLNMTGLFKAEMMSGSIIRQIAVNCICEYLKQNPQIKQIKFLKQKYAKFQDQQKESKLKYSYIGQNLTMKELYNLTGIQFTCTAVDIDNHVLRFFNQKTTPDLPACYAVQMTGSFPVAFEAQTWKKQWGKYYVHYENIRKQIDITGCRITDGGTLANFPVKYLDNQEMRPMYFSHAKTDKTIIYGLGLKTYITETQEQKQAKQEARKNFANYIMSHISKFTVLRSWIKQKVTCCFKPQKRKINLNKKDKLDKNPFQALSNIPLIDFLKNLLQTYSTSKDNLTQQCFQQSSYQTIAGESYINQINLRPSQKSIAQQIRRLQNFVKQNLVIDENSMKSIFIDNFKNFKQATFANYLSQKYLCDIQKNLQQNSAILLLCIEDNLNSQQKNQLKKTMSNIIKNSFHKDVLEQIIDSKNKKEQKDLQYKIEDIFQFIRKITKQRQFVLCSIQEDLKNLEFFAIVFLKLIDQLKNLFVISKPQLLDNKDSILEIVIKQIRYQQQQQLKKIKKHLRAYATQKQPKKQDRNGRDKSKNSYFVDRKIVILLQKLPRLTMTFGLKQIKKIIYQIQHSSVPQFFINFEAQDNKNLIKSYTLNRIVQATEKIHKLPKKQKENNQKKEFLGIHLVLESVPLSEMYFHEYYRIVRETIIEYNEGVNKKLASKKQPISVAKNKSDANDPPQSEKLKQVKVTSLTATGYHSLIMFLYASDLSEERVSQQVWKIRDLIQLDQKQVKSKYENKDWVKITPILLREFQKQAEKNKKDIFEEIKQASKNTDSSKTIENITKNIRKQVDQVRFSNEDMNEAIENSLNYIVGKVMKYEGKNDAANQEINTVKIKELMSELVIDIPGNMFEAKNAEVSAQLKKLSSFFLDKFEDILKYMFYYSPRLVDKIVNSLRPAERQQAWRGILLSQILSGRPIKDYVKSILRELNFKPETTLKQFYEYSEKKIQLNFSVVEQNFVAIYNHISRPNIPLWAAILASASIPQFYSPLVTRPEWTSKFEINYNKRQVQKYFRSPPNPYRLLTSSQTLTRLPLDLLRNNKLKTMVSERENQIFLIFNFSEYQLPDIGKNVIKHLNVAPLTLGELVSKFVNLKKQVFGYNNSKSEEAMNAKALEILTKLPTITSKLKSLFLYIQSHDNLILKLYKSELVQFPIRFDTLDFDKMTVVEKGEQRLSDVCCDAIMQAYFILSQKISNNYSGQKKDSSIIQKKPAQNSVKDVKDQKAQKEDKNKGKLKSKRQIYFRVQSVSKQQLSQKRKLYLQLIKKPSDGNMQQLLDESIINFISNIPPESGGLIMNQQEEFKTLKIRFLSILNPSRKTYQIYHIYYKQNQQQEYKRVQTEQIFVTQNKDNQQMHLKIQFPNSQLTQKKTRCLIIDLRQLYQLSKKQHIKFGFVYKLNFDGLYSDLSINQLTQIEREGKLKIFNNVGGKPINPNRLQPQNFYKQDYMNRNQNINSTPIYIKSDISNINYKAILCEYCVTQVQKVKKKQYQKNQKERNSPAIKNKSQYMYICLNKKCKKKFWQITDKYKVRIDYKKQIYKCAMNHKLQISESFLTDNTSIGDDKKQLNIGSLLAIAVVGQYILDPEFMFGDHLRRSCDLCGKVNFQKLWEDKICNIMICDDCKNNKLEEKNIND